MHDNHALSFLRWFFYNTTFSDDSVLIQLFEYVRKMDMICCILIEIFLGI